MRVGRVTFWTRSANLGPRLIRQRPELSAMGCFQRMFFGLCPSWGDFGWASRPFRATRGSGTMITPKRSSTKKSHLKGHALLTLVLLFSPVMLSWCNKSRGLCAALRCARRGVELQDGQLRGPRAADADRLGRAAALPSPAHPPTDSPSRHPPTDRRGNAGKHEMAFLSRPNSVENAVPLDPHDHFVAASVEHAAFPTKSGQLCSCR